jgi:hypothetical protein
VRKGWPLVVAHWITVGLAALEDNVFQHKFTSGQLVDFLLPDEKAEGTPEESLRRRHMLYQQLRELPTEAFGQLQYLQPQIGCFNRCTFCSQHAGIELWQLSRAGLRDLVAAIRMVITERSSNAAWLGHTRIHKPRVLFPYVDNDIGSYVHLEEYIHLMRDVFGCKVRITTVGFSAQNEELVAMHHRIATSLSAAIAGVRVSITPFTFGWSGAGGAGTATSRRQFWRDISATLAAYRPLLVCIGPGKEAVSVELRFRPLVVTTCVVDTVISGRHVVAAGPHLLLSRSGADRPPECQVSGIHNNIPGRRDQTVAPEPIFTTEGSPYLHVVSDTLAASGVAEYVRRVLAGDTDAAESRDVTLYRMTHCDGPYYAADPVFAADGSMRSLMVYPASARRTSGYNESTRFFLNALLAHKLAKGHARRAEFPDATVRDVAAVILQIRRRAADLARCDQRAARYVRHEVIPLVSGYAGALLGAGLEPALFFSRRFTIDTGQATNQGRGHVLFKGLVSTTDVPANPWEERSYAISNSKGYVWRMAPMPFPAGNTAAPTPARHGAKNLLAATPSMTVQEIDPRHVQARDFDTGAPLRRYEVTGVELEHLDLRTGQRDYLFPGLRRRPGEPANGSKGQIAVSTDVVMSEVPD